MLIVNNEIPPPKSPECASGSTSDTDLAFDYRLVDAKDFDLLQPLWQKLKSFHAELPWHFAGHMHRGTFEQRKHELLSKAASGKLQIEMVKNSADSVDVAYCVSTVTASRDGEIDSIFVDPALRGRGIGSEL